MSRNRGVDIHFAESELYKFTMELRGVSRNRGVDIHFAESEWKTFR